MKIKFFTWIMVVVLLSVSGCGKYDIDDILENQKIIFIMSVASYDESYAVGYFVDATGKKHIYELFDQHPFESIEKEYSYLLEHYDEFETMEFLDEITLRECTEYLYRVNKDAKIREEGTAIMDFPEKRLYGVRVTEEDTEFVWLGEKTGISKSLDNSAADKIFELFGDKWYLLK